MSGLSQLAGVVLASVGGALAWSPWALVIGGAILVVAPEAAELVSAARRAQESTRRTR